MLKVLFLKENRYKTLKWFFKLFEVYNSFKKTLKKTVSLENIKKNKDLIHLSLIKQNKLSVISVDSKSWKILDKMGSI